MPIISVTDVEPILVDLPTIRPHRLSMTTMNRQTLVLVRITCSDEIVGVGEGTTIGGLAYGEESPESICTNIEAYFRPLLIGADATCVVAAMARLRKSIQGNRFASCAIETALLDAQARRLGVPLSALFGGRLRDALPVAWTLASGDTARDIEEAERMLDARRHRVFKLKIGTRDPAEDVAHVAAIKRALGARASVRVDVNQAWSEAQAVRAIAMLEACGCDLVEQPVAAHRVDVLARLAARFDVPIMADEALHGPPDGFALARNAAADVFAIKLAQNAGPTGAARLATVAESAGIALYGGTMLEGGIGTAAAAQIFAGFGAVEFGTELFGPLLLTEEILREPLRYADFMLHVPDGPGTGVELDQEKLAFFRRDGSRRPVHFVASAGA
jgi:muconate cycloisomerase